MFDCSAMGMKLLSSLERDGVEPPLGISELNAFVL